MERIEVIVLQSLNQQDHLQLLVQVQLQVCVGVVDENESTGEICEPGSDAEDANDVSVLTSVVPDESLVPTE